MELTSLDLSILMSELEELEEGFVQQVYQRNNELTLEIYVPGDEKKRLIIGPSYVFISDYKRDNPTRPPGFCMELRKHLGRIDSIKQRGFDRILEIKAGEVKLIVELFGKGNAVLTKDETVIGAIRQEEYAERSVVVGEKYRPPEPTQDPREMDSYVENLGDGELVRKIAADLSFGGTYAEEICSSLDFPKDKDVSELTDEEREAADKEIQNLIENSKNPEPVLYLENGMPERAAPFPLEEYSELEKERFESFSKALDEYYYRREQKKKKKKKQEAYKEKKEGIERQLEQQKRKVEGLEKSSEENREKAETIYEEYQTLDQIKKMIKESIEELGWKETAEKIKESDSKASKMVNSVNEREEFVSVSVDGKNIKLKPDEDLEATASRYYDKAKESERKVESAREAMEETQKRLEEIEDEEIEIEDSMEDKKSERSKKWFEKYRWFYSSEGYLVMIGRDAQTNDMLVNKHMESDDLYFHADFDGAPSVVVKKGQECGEKTREEAARAAVTFSKTWKAGIGADDVYHVNPDQVTENPESGEYLQKGAFVIRGDRTYIRNVSVEAAIGPYDLDGHTVPMCGPKSAVEENCETFLVLETGHEKKSDIAKEIQSRFYDQGYELDLDYIIRCLPPGKSELK